MVREYCLLIFTKSIRRVGEEKSHFQVEVHVCSTNEGEISREINKKENFRAIQVRSNRHIVHRATKQASIKRIVASRIIKIVTYGSSFFFGVSDSYLKADHDRRTVKEEGAFVLCASGFCI